jgi:hypothetical protein
MGGIDMAKKIADFPRTIKSDYHIDGMARTPKNPYKLKFHKKGKYAEYYKESAFGFAHALIIEEAQHKKCPDRKIAVVKHMSGNSWGQTEHGEARTSKKPETVAWMIMRTDYFPSVSVAMRHLQNKKGVPKGKRKPRQIRPFDEEELNEWSDCKKKPKGVQYYEDY